MYKRNVQFEIKFWYRPLDLTSVNRITFRPTLVTRVCDRKKILQIPIHAVYSSRSKFHRNRKGSHAVARRFFTPPSLLLVLRALRSRDIRPCPSDWSRWGHCYPRSSSLRTPLNIDSKDRPPSPQPTGFLFTRISYVMM